MPPLLIVTHHTKYNRPKQDEQPDDQEVKYPIECPLDSPVLSRQRPGHPVHDESHCQDRKVQCRVVMVNISDARHGNKREIMEEPAYDGIKSGVVDLINLRRFELIVPALPAHEVPCHHRAKNTEGEGAAPIDNRVAEEEVFDDVVVPAAHAKADVQDRPLPELRSEVILFVGIRHQGVVGRHHGHVEVHEVA